MVQVPDSTVALLSSGLDSSIALAMAVTKGARVALAITFDYGQRAMRELVQANKIARHFGIMHRIISLPWFREYKSGGRLLNASELPEPKITDLASEELTRRSADAVWVPNRNGVFIEIGAGLAEDLRVQSVLVGFNREEAETFPDNSEVYLESISNALRYSTQTQVHVWSPTAKLTKSEIVKEALKLKFPFPLLWSCYENLPKMCGRCESCVRLKRATNSNELDLGGLFEDKVYR